MNKINITNINALIAPRIVKFIILFAACAAGIVFPSALSAATYTVTNTSDTGAGSLRGAIATANGTTADDTINFAIPSTDANCAASGVCTITLSSGELTISAVSTAGKLTVTNSTDASKLLISGNNMNRVFNVPINGDLTINGLTITNGGSLVGDSGGGILSGGTLTITNSTITNNRTGQAGSGIYNSGIMSLSNSTVSNNIARSNGGPAIFSFGGMVTISYSTISSNSSSGGGIGITNWGNNGTMTVTNSTITDHNYAGIVTDFGGTTTVTNSTVTGNGNGPVIGFGDGDGIVNGNGTTTVTNSTISGNRGGGIWNNVGTTKIRNSISAGNGRDVAYLSGTIISSGNNLIGNATNTGTAISWQPSDILNQSPRLAPLRNYGGATQTMPLRANSPAINAGNNCVLTVGGCGTNDPLTALTADQRGFARNGQVDIGAVERQPIEIFNTPFDFDGDGKSDVSVFRPSNGAWYLQQSTNGFTGLQFGLSTDKLVPADYDGDGKTDVAVYRGGTWYLQRSQLGFFGIAFGSAEDIPVPADYDGDGKADIAVFRPSNGTWYLQRSQLGFTGIAFGLNGDKPVAADYDGDGKADIAVNRAGTWYIQRSQLGFTGVQFGTADDKLVPADYDGDGKTDIAVFRPSNGTWYLQQSAAGFTGIAFGLGTDTPTPADYDGDGKADVAVFRNGTWYLNRSQAGFTGVAFGTATDRPVPNAFVP